MPGLRSLPLLRRATLLAAMAALVLAQSLGLMHRVIHVPHAVSVVPQDSTAMHVAGQGGAEDASSAHGHGQRDGPVASHDGLHASVHAHLHDDGTAHVADPADPTGTESANGLHRLFGGHDETGCDAYDQLAHADFLWGVATGLSARAAQCGALPFTPAGHLAAQAAGYLARGPPSMV